MSYDPMTFLDAEQMDALCQWWQGEEPRLELPNRTVSGGSIELTRDVAGVWISPSP